MKKVLFLSLLIVIVLGGALALAHSKFYLIRASGGGGELIWRSGEAYLFMIDRPFGYHLSVPELIAEPVNEYFYAPTIPEKDSYALTTIHVTSSGVERNVQKATVGISSFTPIGDTIYAACPGGTCKWNGAQFELITSEAEQKVGGSARLTDDWKGFTDINGWSKRSIRAVGPSETPIHGHYSTQISNDTTLLVTEGNPTSVVLQRRGGPTETLWRYKQGLSVVTKATYNRVFESR